MLQAQYWLPETRGTSQWTEFKLSIGPLVDEKRAFWQRERLTAMRFRLPCPSGSLPWLELLGNQIRLSTTLSARTPIR